MAAASTGLGKHGDQLDTDESARHRPGGVRPSVRVPLVVVPAVLRQLWRLTAGRWLEPVGELDGSSSAALQLGVWLLIVITILALLPTMAVAAAEISAGYYKAGSRPAAVISALLAVLLMLGSGWLYWWLIDHMKGLVTLAIAATAFAVVRYGLGPLLQQEAKTGPGLAGERLMAISESGRWATPLRLAITLFLAAAVIGLAFIDLPDDAAEAGACAAKGSQTVPGLNVPIPRVHLPLLNVHAQPATLTWLTPRPPTGIPAEGVYVYLGQAGGSVVVYDVTRTHASHIPAGSVIVSVHSNARPCAGVH